MWVKYEKVFTRCAKEENEVTDHSRMNREFRITSTTETARRKALICWRWSFTRREDGVAHKEKLGSTARH